MLEFALLPHDEPWSGARIPHAAWEYQEPLELTAHGEVDGASFLETSDNVIVEAMRRVEDWIEVRLVECFGTADEAEVTLRLPHSGVTMTDFAGNELSSFARSDHYRFAVRPQQIVTLRFKTMRSVVVPKAITSWDEFVPKEKLEALHVYDPHLSGHPPFGDHPYTFP